jgi:hypothetical protein
LSATVFRARATLGIAFGLTLCTAAVFVSVFLATVAVAAPRASLTAGFSPERLGGRATISFGIKINEPAGQVPPPLAGVELLYPENLGIATSGLGFETCDPLQLQTGGPSSCPTNSFMGFGSALVEVPIGPEIVRESASLTLISGPVQNGHLGLLFFASGRPPIAAQLLFPGLVLPTAAPFGGSLSISMPQIPGVPDGPNVSVAQLKTTLGPSHITYYERRHGKTVAYRPAGILLPKRCPHGGFPFTAKLSFEDGTHASARTLVPCPRS